MYKETTLPLHRSLVFCYKNTIFILNVHSSNCIFFAVFINATECFRLTKLSGCFNRCCVFTYCHIETFMCHVSF